MELLSPASTFMHCHLNNMHTHTCMHIQVWQRSACDQHMDIVLTHAVCVPHSMGHIPRKRMLSAGPAASCTVIVLTTGMDATIAPFIEMQGWSVWSQPNCTAGGMHVVATRWRQQMHLMLFMVSIIGCCQGNLMRHARAQQALCHNWLVPLGMLGTVIFCSSWR